MAELVAIRKPLADSPVDVGGITALNGGYAIGGGGGGEGGVVGGGVGAQEKDSGYKVYRRRWLLMFAVVMLNISNAALWITYAPVATTVSQFYDKYDGQVNFFSVVFLLVSIPFCFITTFSINLVGLGAAIHAGSALNCLGAVVKALGTSSFITSSDTQYSVSLVGQVIAAMAQSFLLFIPTKVSQTWFPAHQRTISTTLISLSNPLGIVVGQMVTPALVFVPADLPKSNYVWMGVAIFAQICTILFVRSSNPPTPPSLSSERGEQDRPPYLQQLVATVTCRPYLILLVMLGFGIAFISAVSTYTQQMLCGLGYSNAFSGLASGLLMLGGFLGSAFIGVYVDKTKQFTPVCKLCYGAAAIMTIGMLVFYLQPGQGVAILVFCSLFGFFGVGAYPIGLELAVEATYPVDETISTAFIFLSGKLQGVIIIAVIGLLATEQKPQYEHLQVCSVDNSKVVAKDYSTSVVTMMVVMSVLVMILIIFFDTPYKRQLAEGRIRPSPASSSPLAEVVSTTQQTIVADMSETKNVDVSETYNANEVETHTTKESESHTTKESESHTTKESESHTTKESKSHTTKESETRKTNESETQNAQNTVSGAHITRVPETLKGSETQNTPVSETNNVTLDCNKSIRQHT